MSQVVDITNLDQAVPLLSDLRYTLDPTTLESRLKVASTSGYRVLGIKRDDQMVGVLGYRLVNDICWGKTFYVDDMNISSDARNEGLGGLLPEAAKSRAEAERCDQLRLCSGLSRTDAHRFYEAHDMKGFSLQFFLPLKEQ